MLGVDVARPGAADNHLSLSPTSMATMIGMALEHEKLGYFSLNEGQSELTIPEVKPMRYGDISKAVDTMETANRNDPVEHYVYGTLSARTIAATRAELRIQCILGVRKKMSFTINHGDATVSCLLPGQQQPGKGIDLILEPVLQAARRLVQVFRSKKEKKRREEFLVKFRAALEQTFGESRNSMVELGGLSTHPSKQRRGYGTALVKFVTNKADILGCPTWLGSSNVDNTGFYEAFGFITVAEFTLGESDPDWKEPPVIVRIMLREPLSYTDEKRS